MNKIVKREYNLEKRTLQFSKDIISLCKKVEITTITRPIIDQLIKSGTSMGANYTEANGASSKRDFKNKIFICKKESKETVYWLELLAHILPKLRDGCKAVWQEAKELTMIFATIAKNTEV